MMLSGFIPKILQPTDEYLAERTLRVVRIGGAGMTAGSLISLLLVLLIYSQQGLEY